MYKPKILAGLVLMLYVLFIFFEFSDAYNMSILLDALVVPTIALTYILLVKKKNIFFLLFVICYSLSDILGVVTHYLLYFNFTYEESLVYYDYDYFIGSVLYIMSYIFLLIRVLSTISMKYIFKHFKIHLLVLMLLNVYLVYVLQIIVDSNLDSDSQFYIEFAYNTVMLLLLSSALLNYFYRDNKKSLYLFIGSLFVVFSEVLDVAYIYIDQKSLLSIFSTTLVLAAFYFYYQQTRFSDKLLNKEEDRYMILE
jgi:hypothetical protein